MSGGAGALVHALYHKVVSDVVAKSREEFLGEGLDASVLLELQTRWERKLALSGAVPAPAPPATEAVAAGAAAGGHQAPAPASGAAPGAAGASGARVEPLALLGRPLPFLPAAAGWIAEATVSEPEAAPPPEQPAATSQPQPKAVDARRKRKLPDAAAEEGASQRAAPRAAATAFLPEVVPVAAPPPAAPSADPDREELDSDDEERDPDTKNLVLTQFEKVTHAKNKWKCTLRSGVMTLNGKDCVFLNATGDFAW